MRVRADGESVGTVVTFAPPAVENAEAEAAMATGLHAAGAGSFQRTARVVQPDIAAGNHLARNVNVIVFQEDQIPGEFAVLAQVNDLLNEPFAVVVPRMRLAGKNELHRALLVANQFHDVFELLENQRGALVGRKTPGKTDGQGIGV